MLHRKRYHETILVTLKEWTHSPWSNTIIIHIIIISGNTVVAYFCIFFNLLTPWLVATRDGHTLDFAESWRRILTDFLGFAVGEQTAVLSQKNCSFRGPL